MERQNRVLVRETPSHPPPPPSPLSPPPPRPCHPRRWRWSSQRFSKGYSENRHSVIRHPRRLTTFRTRIIVTVERRRNSPGSVFADVPVLSVLSSLHSAQPPTLGLHRRTLLYSRPVPPPLLPKFAVHHPPHFRRVLHAFPLRRRSLIRLPPRPRDLQHGPQNRTQAYVHRRGLGEGRPLACRTPSGPKVKIKGCKASQCSPDPRFSIHPLRLLSPTCVPAASTSRPTPSIQVQGPRQGKNQHREVRHRYDRITRGRGGRGSRWPPLLCS